MSAIAFATDTAFQPPHRGGAGGDTRRFFWPRPPFERIDGYPLVEHICMLAAAKDPETGVFVVVDITNLGVIFEVEHPDQIVEKANAILSDLIEENGWPQNGWAILADVHDDLSALRPWID